MTTQSEIFLYKWCKVWCDLRADYNNDPSDDIYRQIVNVERKMEMITNNITQLLEEQRHRVEPLDSLT